MLNEQMLFQLLRDADRIPISDEEACVMLSVQKTTFDKAVKSGIIKKSVSIHYRLGLYLNFVGLYDVLEYALRSEFFFLNYGLHPDVNELIGGVVDELSLLIDSYHLDSLPNLSYINNKIELDLMHFYAQEDEVWKRYWLFSGDTFSPEIGSQITLKTWNVILGKFMETVA